MVCYAVFLFSSITPSRELDEYAESVDSTLGPFAGRFVVRGGDYEVWEGSWPGPLVVIEFKDRATAQQWYESPAYRRIKALRQHSSDASVILIDGVDSE